ncbi:oplophorus-luciferin 2-monooxygenase non-catalytic subunit-like [Uloborus diversus]|uniref:oplophorus-luciferin 2-monooxygenase non-catalytic subunit-like n=1 Tax=Uloborus diversus TaxID=327109 RepID=UPI0024096BF0|nr:oplophorus-luciferin 2-monooxygenase non-catalytic subunit-like [Uloborus diversus]
MSKISIVLFILQSIIIVNSLANLCPPFEDLQPCGCVSDGKNIRIDCYQITSVEALKPALSSLKGIKHLFIDFIRARLDSVPSDLFKGLDIYKLSFTNCDLKSFGDKGRSALEGLEDTIEEFSIHFSFEEDNELKFLNVSSLRVIEDLEIEGNEMTILGNEWFAEGPHSLKNLYIMTNLLQELGDQVFRPLSNLKNLWLTGNQLKALKRSMFPSPANHLTTLDLTNNELSSLPEDMFQDMPSLKEVILAENELTTLHETTWIPVWSRLTSAYLESNPLDCDSHIEWTFDIRRPYVLKGVCVSPESRKGKDLKRLIDDSQLGLDV